MAAGDLLSFGPYLLDTRERRLTRDGADVRIASRHLDLLCLLASHPGQVISKETLIEGAWRDVAVTTGSLDQAIYLLRRTLTMPSGEPCIETQARRGIRFVAEVSTVPRRETDDSLDAILETHRVWIDGRAALETLEASAIVRARAAFERVVERMPEQATAHVGLANACALQFEMTRTDAEPDVAALKQALAHALEARRLDRKYGVGHARVRARAGRATRGRAGRAPAVDRAGAGQLAAPPAAGRVQLGRGALARGTPRAGTAAGRRHGALLAASVLVARGLLDDAEQELRTALTAFHDDMRPSPFGCVAVNWLLGLLRLARGARVDAMDAFHRELAQEHSGHLYAKEVAANTWYAIGAARFRAGERDDAQEAFLECLKRVPKHPLARAGLGEPPPATGASSVDRTIAQAVYLSVDAERPERHAAAPAIDRALAESPTGNAGWLLPVEPMRGVAEDQARWVNVLARLCRRAA